MTIKNEPAAIVHLLGSDSVCPLVFNLCTYNWLNSLTVCFNEAGCYKAIVIARNWTQNIHIIKLNLVNAETGVNYKLSWISNENPNQESTLHEICTDKQLG